MHRTVGAQTIFQVKNLITNLVLNEIIEKASSLISTIRLISERSELIRACGGVRACNFIWLQIFFFVINFYDHFFVTTTHMID